MKKLFNPLLITLSIVLFSFFNINQSDAIKPSDYGLKNGDVISAEGDPDVYIINDFGYKRLFVNPEIFKLYGHLGWNKIKKVSSETKDAFITSGLFRNCESGDIKVYGLEVVNEDWANLRWVNTSGIQATIDDPAFFKKVFCINNAEVKLYGVGAHLLSIKDIPNYTRTLQPYSLPGQPQKPVSLQPIGEYNEYKRHNLDIVYQFNSMPRPSWVPIPSELGPGGKIANHPYDGSVFIATSADGINFSGKKLFIHHAGVPHIMMTKDNKLVATFQYFSPTDITIFDVIAYTTSDDMGKTWSPINRFYVRDLCPSERNKCNDPVLLQTEDGKFRLYFSHSGPQELGFWMYSAINDRLDTPFTDEGPQVDASDVSDPAVVFFKNQWHYYANKGDAETMGKFYGVHAISDTGQKFTRISSSILLDLPFLGDVIEDSGKLRFFSGEESAYSVDGDIWSMEAGIRIGPAADPGVVKLLDGSYLMLYVSAGPESVQ